MKAFNDEEKTIICRLLAQADAVWRPWRNPNVAGWGALSRLRRDYVGEGLPWHSGGASASERKAAERLLAKLAGGGMVKTSGPKGKVSTARLTTAGEAQARTLFGLPGRAAALGMLDEIADLRRELGGMADCGGDGDWIPETLLCRMEWGAPGFADRAWHVELFAAPLATAGLVVSNATGEGHCYFRMTPAGAALSAARARAAKGARKTRAAWRCAAPTAEYLSARTRHKETLETTPTDSRDIGLCPLPVAGWSEDFAVKYRAKMQAMASGK